MAELSDAKGAKPFTYLDFLPDDILSDWSDRLCVCEAAEQLDPAAAALLASPNDILAIEYLKAVRRQGLALRPLAVRRRGPGHDSPQAEEGLLSASAIREKLCPGGEIVGVPEESAPVLEREMRLGRGPVRPGDLETALLARLRMLSREDFAALPDAGEGLGDRLYAALRDEATLEGALAAAKTRRYAMSRLRRMTLCAALGVRAGLAQELPDYTVALAANKRGRALLRDMKRTSAIPLITKPSDGLKLPGRAGEIFRLECAADDLYVLGFSAPEQRRCGGSLRASPYMPG